MLRAVRGFMLRALPFSFLFLDCSRLYSAHYFKMDGNTAGAGSKNDDVQFEKKAKKIKRHEPDTGADEQSEEGSESAPVNPKLNVETESGIKAPMKLNELQR